MLKKTKPVDDTSLTLKRKMKFQNDLNAKKPKLSLTLKPVNLIPVDDTCLTLKKKWRGKMLPLQKSLSQI